MFKRQKLNELINSEQVTMFDWKPTEEESHYQSLKTDPIKQFEAFKVFWMEKLRNWNKDLILPVKEKPKDSKITNFMKYRPMTSMPRIVPKITTFDAGLG